MRKIPRLKITRTSIAVIAILLLVFLGLCDYGVNVIYNQRTTVVQSYNSLAAELDHEVIPSETLSGYSPLSFPKRLIELVQMLPKLNLVNGYKLEKQVINDKFDTEVRAYLLDITKFAAKVNYTPAIDLNTIDFATKKSPDKYIAQLKSDFRKQIVANNATTDEPLRFQFDVNAQIAQMSLDAKIDQLFQFAITGQSVNDNLRNQLQTVKAGGISLFGENISGESQLAQFDKSIQATNAEIPVLIATDQEGGIVKRIWWDNGGSEPQIAYSEPGALCDVYLNRGRTLKAAGINWNFGIVADATSNPAAFIYPRVFSGDFDLVAKDVAVAASCTNATLSTLKHWPGHGETNVDTHTQIGTLTKNENDWKNTDWKPFAAGIAKGADSIMVGHLIIPWLDDKNPATTCAKCIGYLRDTLGYKGLIITDDLNMLLNDGYTHESAVSQAFAAGNDILVINVNDLATQQNLISAIRDMVNSGQVTLATLDSHIARILTAKNKVIAFGDDFVPANLVY